MSMETNKPKFLSMSLDLDTIIENNYAMRNLKIRDSNHVTSISPKVTRLRASTMMKETLTGRKTTGRDPSPHAT